MRVFVTGGTGFIGAHVVRKLRERGHEAHCLVRSEQKAKALEVLGVSTVRGDVTDPQTMVDTMRGREWVVNLANLFEFWVPHRRTYAQVNIDGTRNVMMAALEAKVTKVVHVSTAAVYGNAPWPITESSPLGPKCSCEYARTKRAGDLIAWDLFAKRQLPLVMLYPAAVLGPDNPKAAGRYVSNVARGAMPAQVTTKRQFSWVHVGDVAEAVVRALENDVTIGEKYLIAAENLTFGQINALIAEIAGVRLPRLALPNWMTWAGALVMTRIADLTRRPPVLDMAIDQMRLMMQGFEVDGSKAVRELGLMYTPIRTTIEEIVASLRAPAT